MPAAHPIRSVLDRLLDAVVILLMATLVVDILWQVFSRYALASPSSWTEELATFLLIWLGLLGAAVGLREHAHLGIDYLTTKLQPGRRRATELFAFASTAAFCAVVLTYGGLTLVLRTLALDQTSPALGVPMGYVYLALPIGGLFLTWYSAQSLVARLAPRGAAED